MRRELGRPRHRPTRGQEAIRWIEDALRFPDGPRRGERVVLTQEERDLVRRIYDDGGWSQDEHICGAMAAYLALMHTFGPRAPEPVPAIVEVDIFTLRGRPPGRAKSNGRYGEIGISAVVAALQFKSKAKNPAYAPVIPKLDNWIADEAA